MMRIVCISQESFLTLQRSIKFDSTTMRLIKKFLHAVFCTAYYWGAFKFHVQRHWMFDRWRGIGYILIGAIMAILLIEPIKIPFYCFEYINGYSLTRNDVQLHSHIACPIAIIIAILIAILLKRENFIESIITEITSTEKQVFKQRYRYTLFKILPILLSPLILMWLRVHLKNMM